MSSPSDLDLERFVLTTALLSETFLEDALPRLAPKHFADGFHAKVWEAIITVGESSHPNSVEVARWLDVQGIPDAGSRLGSMLSRAAEQTGSNWTAVHSLIDLWRLRELVRVVRDIEREAHGQVVGVSEFLAGAEQRIHDLAEAIDATSQLLSADDVVAAAYRELLQPTQRVTTGFADLDQALGGGMVKTGLYVLAARPGMGKSALALNVLERGARNGHGGLLCSLEMGASQLGARLLAGSVGGEVNSVNAPDGASDLSGLSLRFDVTSGQTLAHVRASIRRAARELKQAGTPLAVAVVDYLQLMTGEGQSREQEVAGLSRGLKVLAMEMGIVIIALSQLNRSVETRSDKRPKLSDLRESGALEQDADGVIFIYRDDYYDLDARAEVVDAEIILAKHRHPTGPGICTLQWRGAATKFESPFRAQPDEWASDYDDGLEG